ncbi:MAG TPA: DUF4149 domain-containing protein [Tepidisphaeraceae bacterium]|nr:DUF4149 domain-containing protein [Tepidisphaeraceae bacterium]
MKLFLEVFRRFAFVSSVVLWLGGFTFYTGVVIPTGARALHSHLKQGLVTQQVTGWLNLIGIVALAILLWNVLATPRRAKWAYWTAMATWIVMALVQIALFVLHPIMDRLIVKGHVTDEDRFVKLHGIYGAISTAQWACGVIHVIAILYIWTVIEHVEKSAGHLLADAQHGGVG